MKFISLLLAQYLYFYDPVFNKDLSLFELKNHWENILGGKGSYIESPGLYLSERPTLSFTPDWRVLVLNKNSKTYVFSRLDLEFSAGVKVDNFKLGAEVHFFNFQEPIKFQYWEPFANETYKMYSFDIQPIIGKTSLMDIYVKKAYLEYEAKNFGFLVGRREIRIGEGLVFSGQSYPLDHVYRLQFNFGKFKVISAFGVPPDTVLTRTISYQALEWKPVSNFIFTVYEAVSHTGPDVFKYFNPLSLYYERQRRGKTNVDNLVGGLAVKYNFKKVSLFFDLLDDDIIIFEGGTNKYAFASGFEVIPESNSILRFSFTAIPRFTYTHVSDSNAWHVLQIPLGYPRGNDLIDFYLSYAKFLGNKEAFVVRLAQLNKGEGTLTEKFEGSGLPRNMPYPTGKVRRDWVFQAGYFKKFVYTGILADFVYKGRNHLFGAFVHLNGNIFTIRF